ncbi:uncharacterized protein L201_002897 [Kwoniella dendrophila CBS 6074]|uniref:Rap-GAP domain-containing protein n=1 Tax=Kwoniella dendrophila CBS 6074 TaxID=1295534 RepID=A0AAX4JTT7_9TREE
MTESNKKDRLGLHLNPLPSSSSSTSQSQNNTPSIASAGSRFLSRRVWGRASATTKTSTGQEDELPTLSNTSSSTTSSNTISNHPLRKDSTEEVVIKHPNTQIFHLDEAIHLMDPSNEPSVSPISSPELIELIKATSVYITNLKSDNEREDPFSPSSSSSTVIPTITQDLDKDIERKDNSSLESILSEDVIKLYSRAISFSDRRNEISLRIAGIRLLTSLMTYNPPPKYFSEQSKVVLPDTITVRTMYNLITGSGSLPSDLVGDVKSDLIGVQVMALKILSKNGSEVEGLTGLIGWLMRMLEEIKDDWSKWCEMKPNGGNDVPTRPPKLKPFDPITPYSPLETASAIIDLIHSISLNFIDLFDPSKDVSRIIQPIFSFVSKGIIASTPPSDLTGLNISQSHVPPPNPFRRESITSLVFNSPLPTNHNGSILESGLRRSASITRRKDHNIPSAFSTPSSSRFTRHSTLTSPQSLTAASTFQSPSPQFPSIPMPKWLHLLPSACTLMEVFIDNTVLPQDLFIDIMRFACICVAYDDESGLPTDVGQIPVHKLLAVLFRSNNGRRGELALRIIMEQDVGHPFKIAYEGLSDADCRVVQGAVYIARSLLLHLDDPSPNPTTSPSASLSSLSPSLMAALSTTRFMKPEDRNERPKWEPVDYAVLTLLQDHLHRLEQGSGKDVIKADIWTEGQAACDILKALWPVATPSRVSGLGMFVADEHSTFAAIFDAVIHQLPGAIEKLHPSGTSAVPFYHPKYIDLLFNYGDRLSEEDAGVILDYYQTEGLCLPMTSGWIENTWKLINTFYQSTLNLPSANRKLAMIIFQDLYPSTEEMSEPRSEFVDKVVVPFLEKVLLKQTEDWFRQEALSVMIRAAVSETMERDEERRQVRDTKNETEVEEEDASALPSQEVKEAAAGGSFHAIRNLIISLASTAWCKEDEHIPSRSASERRRPAPQLSRDSTISNHSNTNSSALKGLMNVLSPPTRTKELPPVAPSIASTDDTTVAATPRQHSTDHRIAHSDCQSLGAVSALIKIFNDLTFSPPHSFSSSIKAARTPASSRCIAIYRDLLGLLYPFTDHAGDQTPSSRIAAVPARCPRARIAILQWLMRLRADPKHRIYLRQELDIVGRSYAETLFRTSEAVDAQRSKLIAEAEESRARNERRQQYQQPQQSLSSGRESLRDRTMTSTRSRSRSRPPNEHHQNQAQQSSSSSSDTLGFTPLWFVPETLAFSMPADPLPSEGLLTYDPNHPSLRVKDAPPVEGVWLPVSEYVRALNGILRHETNWELVSYVLCFLPIQLSNKLFFRGGRATKEVKALLKALIDLIPQDDRIERRCKYHQFIKRPNVNAAVYQSLSILIAYRDVLESHECDALIAAFESCLESNSVVAKPCIQALTLSIFELEQSVGKRLLSIIGKLRDINFTSGIAVHLLEFLLALGENKNLFKNFTDSHYKDVFTLVIDYIAEHNARSDQSPDLENMNTRENYTLSQHVIGLAYHSIYVWFISLKLSIRPDLVKHIIVKLLQSRSKRVAVDEMAEVCLDWLARYTYGNADPKPANSFLSDMVLKNNENPEEKSKTQSWLLGGCIITITAHPRTGWSTITSTRPTGATEIIAKLENVPLLNLGESNADLQSLPAVLMGNRGLIMNDPSKSNEASDIVNQESNAPQTEFDQSSQQGYIWSGATPSQRRKDVSIDPAYLAVELLSSYPNANLETPRGRLIPNEEKFLRALRTIESTPVIDTSKLGVLYVGKGQTTENEILGNTDGSSLYLDFLSGLGRLIRLKGQVDVFVGGLNKENDSDGEYAYAWWDDLKQTIFHTATMMPNDLRNDPTFSRKKRLIGNDYVKIIYNDSGKDFKFDTITTSFNFINIVISPHTTPESHGPSPSNEIKNEDNQISTATATEDQWAVWGRDDYFKIIIQRLKGIPEFSPIGEHKIISKENLPIFIRYISHLSNDLAARYTHIKDAKTPEQAEYITSWRSRLRSMNRLRASLPQVEKVDPNDEAKREEMLRE